MAAQHIHQTGEPFLHWCQALMGREDWVIFEVESSGQLISQSEAIALAVVDHRNRPILDHVLRPRVPLENGIAPLHDVYADVLSYLPSFREIFPELIRVLEGKTIIAYNAVFASGVLNTTARLLHLELPAMNWQCAMIAYAQYWQQAGIYRGSVRWQALTEACRQQNITTAYNAHRCLKDAQRVYALLQTCAQTGHPQWTHTVSLAQKGDYSYD